MHNSPDVRLGGLCEYHHHRSVKLWRAFRDKTLTFNRLQLHSPSDTTISDGIGCCDNRHTAQLNMACPTIPPELLDDGHLRHSVRVPLALNPAELTRTRSFIGTIVLMSVKNKNTATKAGLLISYYITLSFWAAQTLAMSMLSRNVGGQTKKSIAVTLNFVFW